MDSLLDDLGAGIVEIMKEVRKLKGKFKVLVLLLAVCLVWGNAVVNVKAEARNDVQVDVMDDNVTAWTGIDYAVPDIYLFESGGYTAVGESKIPYPAILRGHSYDESWFGGYVVDFGYTLQSGYKYIFAWNNKYYPLFAVESDSEKYISGYTQQFPWVESIEDALEQASSVAAGYTFYCPLDVDMDNSILTYRDVYDRYNESALIVQDTDGVLYRVCISDLFKYNFHNITDYKLDGKNYISVKKGEDIYNSEGLCIGNKFIFYWDKFPVNYSYLYLEVDDECLVMYDEILASAEEKKFFAGKSELEVALKLQNGKYSWKLSMDGITNEDGSVCPAVSETGTLEIVNVVDTEDLGNNNIDLSNANIRVSAIPDSMFLGDILNIEFTSDIPVVFEFNGESSVVPVTSWVYSCVSNLVGKWTASVDSQVIASDVLEVNCFKIGAGANVAYDESSGVSANNNNDKLAQTGSGIIMSVVILVLSCVLVCFLVRCLKGRRDV